MSIASVRRARIKTIIEVTSAFFNRSTQDVIGAKRTANLVRARHIAMYFARKLTKATFYEIGTTFNNRDHTTVMHAVEQLELKMPAEASLAEQMAYLEKQFVEKFKLDEVEQAA